MKTAKKFVTYLITGLLASGLFLSFTACSEQSPFESSSPVPGSLAKKKVATTDMSLESTFVTASTATENTIFTGSVPDAYPQTGSCSVKFKRNEYSGGVITLPNGSTFYFGGGALTPPPDVPYGDPLTITMTAEMVDNELMFSFGPSGCQFDPTAQVQLSWKDLNMDVPALYYINKDGSYTEQQPDDISLQGRWMLLNIHHFSRYAVAWGE